MTRRTKTTIKVGDRFQLPADSEEEIPSQKITITEIEDADAGDEMFIYMVDVEDREPEDFDGIGEIHIDELKKATKL